MSGPADGAGLEPVIGLEVHVQLRTGRKLFCGDATRFGDAPNTNVCPVCLGLPGALPTLSREAVELAVRTALAFRCVVHETSVFARKNYFYPDLPKGYQISQFDRPLATGGRFEVETAKGTRGARVRRIHLEEDAGKSLHDRFESATAIDLNRAGTPLLELVTEPDLRSPTSARAWLQGLKQTLEYLDVSDCNMEEGSLRVDANVSVRPRGAAALGPKTELKNLNSFSAVERALDVEIARQRAARSRGEPVEPATLLWDERRGEVRPMRTKEESHDYRYFPEPDLPPLRISRKRVEELREALPELPAARRARFLERYGLPAYDVGVLTATRALADYYEALAGALDDPKVASNWMMGPVLASMKERGEEPGVYPVRPDGLAGLVRLVEEGAVNRAVGKAVLRAMADTGRGAGEIVDARGLARVSEPDRLGAWVDEAIARHPAEAARYREGETRLQGFFMGEVMKRSRGKADPAEVARLLAERLEGRR